MKLYLGMGYLDDVRKHTVWMERRTFIEEGSAGIAPPHVTFLEGIETAIDFYFCTQLVKGHGGIRVITHQPDVSIVGSGINLFGRKRNGAALLVFREGGLCTGIGI